MPMKLLVAGAVLLGGCSTVPDAAPVSAGIGPREAIVLAADAAPNGISGTFILVVRATGREGGRVYLNSELDYRDQRCLTINVNPAAAQMLEERFGSAPDVYFRGKSIRVRGTARRVQIHFIAAGRPTGKYYYQTHVDVSSADQIELANST
jgi:hypothetical protein